MFCSGSLCARPTITREQQRNMLRIRWGTYLSCPFGSAGVKNVDEMPLVERKGFPLNSACPMRVGIRGFSVGKPEGLQAGRDYGRGGVDDTPHRAAGAAKLAEWSFEGFVEERWSRFFF